MSKNIPVFNHIAAILPHYTATGDTTTIITTDGKQTTNAVSIRTVLRRLAHSRSTDLTALRRNTALATGKTILQPLPIAPGLVLCPLKTRVPKVTGDTSTGYINYHAVTGVAEKNLAPYQTVVTLAGGTDIPVYWTSTTVKQHLQSAKLAMSYTSQPSAAHPDLMPLAQKLVEIIYDLLVFKNQKE